MSDLNCCFCHCTQQFFVIFVQIVVFMVAVGFLKLDPLMSYAIACNTFFKIFLEIVIFVSFVDFLRLFVIACNPGQKSLYTLQLTLSIFPNVCLLAVSVQLKASNQSLGFMRRNIVLAMF